MTLRNFYIFAFVFLLAFQSACGQNQDVSNITENEVIEKEDFRVNNLKKQANELRDAFNKNDFERFVELTHPLVIEKAGSREKIISVMKKVVAQNSGIFKSFSFSLEDPTNIVKVDGQLFGVIPHKMEGITLNNHKILQIGCSVGVSDDNGKNWKFVNGEMFNNLFPSMVGKIEIIKEKSITDGIEQ